MTGISFYAFPKTNDELSDAVIIGTILFCGRMTIVVKFRVYLLYVSVQFSLEFDVLCDVLYAPINVSTRVREFIIVTHVYHACVVLFMGFPT